MFWQLVEWVQHKLTIMLCMQLLQKTSQPKWVDCCFNTLLFCYIWKTTNPNVSKLRWQMCTLTPLIFCFGGSWLLMFWMQQNIFFWMQQNIVLFVVSFSKSFSKEELKIKEHAITDMIKNNQTHAKSAVELTTIGQWLHQSCQWRDRGYQLCLILPRLFCVIVHHHCHQKWKQGDCAVATSTTLPQCRHCDHQITNSKIATRIARPSSPKTGY